MSYDSYECLKVRVDRYVASVTIDHPPINLFDRALMLEFHYLGKQLAGDPDVKVAVFASVNPDFLSPTRILLRSRESSQTANARTTGRISSRPWWIDSAPCPR